MHDSGLLSRRKVYQKLEVVKTKDPFCFKRFVSLKARRILAETPCKLVIDKVIAGYVFASSKSYALTFTHIHAISNCWPLPTHDDRK